MEESKLELTTSRQLKQPSTTSLKDNSAATSASSVYSQLYPIVSRYAVLILFTCSVVAVCAAMESMLPYQFAKFMHAADSGNLLRLIVLVIGCCLINGAKKYFSTVTKEMVLLSLRGYCFGKFLRNDMPFFQKNSTAQLLNLILADVKKVQATITKTLFNISKNITAFLTTVVLMAMVNGWLTLVLLSTLPFSIYFNYKLTKTLKQNSKQYNSASVESMAYALGVFRGIQVCKSYSNEERDLQAFGDTTDKVYGIGRKKAMISSLLVGINALLRNVSTAATVWVGFVLLASSNQELNVVASFLLYTLSVNKTLNALSQMVIKLSNNSASIERMLQLVNYQSANRTQEKRSPDEAELASSETQIVLDPAFTMEASQASRLIEFKSVSFRYSKKRGYVLRDFDLIVPSGEYLGIVGPSGCGKSTILKLLLGLYEPTDGRIVCTFERSRVAYVPQEAVIFSGTLRQNIDYSQNGLTEAKLLEICKQTGIYDLVMELPDKFETKVGCKGVQLSGGQKQRICLARALSIKPHLLLLDEATASLDTKNEQLVCQTVSSISRRRKITIIFISHRFRRSSDFSRIVMLKEGSIQGVGTHQQLIRENSDYRKMYELQCS